MSSVETEKSRRRRLAVKVYNDVYEGYRPGRPFLPPSQIRDMITFGKGKYMPVFGKVCTFLEKTMEEFGGRNEFKHLLKDYFSLLFKHYWQYKRIPTLKQITGPRIEDIFRNWVFKQEEELGSYWVSQEEVDRAKFCAKWDCWGQKSYDPFLPHLWSGPGDPSKVPELNRGTLPVHLGFRELVKYRLIDPPQEDIDEYNRLWVEDEEANRWLDKGNSEVVKKPGPPARVSEKPNEMTNKYGITRGPIVVGAPVHETPPRVSVVPKRTPPARAKQVEVPKRLSTGVQRVPQRVERT